MKQYDAKDLITAITKHNQDYKCPFCNDNHFSVVTEAAQITISDKLDAVELGKFIPAGAIICQKCGHIDFFSLGTLGLLDKKEEE